MCKTIIPVTVRPSQPLCNYSNRCESICIECTNFHNQNEPQVIRLSTGSDRRRDWNWWFFFPWLSLRFVFADGRRLGRVLFSRLRK